MPARVSEAFTLRTYPLREADLMAGKAVGIETPVEDGKLVPREKIKSGDPEELRQRARKTRVRPLRMRSLPPEHLR